MQVVLRVRVCKTVRFMQWGKNYLLTGAL